MGKDIEKNILNAAIKVVSQEKISGTRMHMIAKEANMSQANLHYHFATKNDIMIAILDSIQEQFSSRRTKYIDLKNKSTAENIRGFFEQKKDEILNNKEAESIQVDYWVQGTANDEIRSKFQNTFNIWRSNISEVLNKSEFKDDLDKKYNDMIPFIMVSIMLGASFQYLIDEGKFDLEEYFDIAEKIMFEKYLKTEK
ncbi:TetR/AcrR family transcriptional regulator [Clostridium sp. P21]|uniref:TetR/AcrR family transcriptional regulator n=1 Tax=Clostridium muellerianum TaxID=2716538 RepID=A0A7Y0EF21_9CLOT|nr:TetR/AcrR family transcriptional regulator [Clostridium muellerianum]NMM62329.1 TetR/AcrR family transcriptional regulator [Clostridium muellerianum]